MKIIKLTQGKETIVDDDTFEAIGRLKWYAIKMGPNFYAARWYRRNDGAGRHLYLHHAVVGYPLHKKEVNHKFDSLGNRRESLEIVSKRRNQNDRKSHRAGRLPGTYPNGRKWVSRIQINGKTVYLGSFKTEAAASARHFEETKIIETRECYEKN